MRVLSFFSNVLKIGLLVCVCTQVLAQQDYTSVQDGDWNDNDTWGTPEGDFPSFGNSVLIDGHEITINVQSFAGVVTVQGAGSLLLSDQIILSALNMSGTSSISGTNTLTSFGLLTVTSGTVSINSGTVESAGVDVSSGSLTVDAASLNITGSSTISGSFVFTSATGDKTFYDVTVESGGTWNNTITESFTVRSITNNGTWNGCSNTTDCTYTVNNGSRVFSGSNEISLPILNISTTVTNAGILEITNQLTGSGTFNNGNGVVDGTTLGTLELNGDGPFSISTIDFSTNANTVTYSGAGSITARNTNYRNLTINKSSDDVTLGGSNSVVNTLTLTNGNLVLGANNLIIPSGATISGGSASSYLELTGASGVVVRGYSSAPFPAEASTLELLPMGNSSGYAPLSFQLVDASDADGNLNFDFRGIVHGSRDNDNSASGGDDDGTPAVDYMNCYWTFTLDGISEPTWSALGDFSSFGFTNGGDGANTMVPVVLREGTIGAFSNVPDWHVAGLSAGQGSGSVSATELTFTELNGFENTSNTYELYGMDNTDERLPVELLNFDAKTNSEGVNLNWRTSEEINNDFFIVQRSVDGKVFKDLVMVDGAGNSDQILEYSYLDTYPLSGRSYYRLKQTDFNGQFEYSDIRSVLWEGDRSNINLVVYPNPVSQGSIINVAFSEEIEVLDSEWFLSDLSGRIVESNYLSNNERLAINTSTGLNKGIYIFKLRLRDGSLLTKRISIR